MTARSLLDLDILVVSDSAASLATLRALVLAAGYMANTAASASAALAHVQAQEPDLVLLDLRSPELDSCELTRRLRLLHEDHLLQVIVVGATHDDEQVIHALRSGADDYLARPLSATLLAAKLHHSAGRQRLQSRLARLAQRQLDIIDNIADAVITLDVNGHVEDMNAMAHALFDTRPTSHHALPWSGGDCLSLLGLPLAELLSRRECQLRRADGSWLSVDISCQEWRERSGMFYTLVLRDLTEKRANEQRQNEFLATVSHELRTPLTSVLGSLGLLAGGAAGRLPAAAMQLAAVAQRNGKRLSRLIDDLLDITKIRSDQFVQHQREQAVGPLLQEALLASQAYAGSLGVQLEAEGVEAHGGTELRLDADRFLQVMANLLSNAIKHSPAGEVVKLRLAVTSAVLRVSVIDRGPGIEPAFRSQLFNQFSKNEAGDLGGQPSSGLGLYISRLLVERMGGQIDADPVAEPPSHGASFTVTLPLAFQPTMNRSAA
jgi:signal transduction histidine kinase/CheY-like chemotaxis protein